MRKIYFLYFLLFLSIVLNAQPYQIGHRSITYNDPARSRNIPVHVYYPAATAGDNVAVAGGQFPLIVFGHGFVMTYSAYQNFWDSLVPRGYIMVFPTTEGSMFPTPDHDAFGKDLKFLNTKMKDENVSSTSPFYQKLAGTSALMGHSMGGGASFLAAAANSDITALINFAAANTTPSAIDVCPSVSVPTVIFYGENDGVAPPSAHQILMYSALGCACKTIIGINGGGHCYFANYNLSCSTGEMTTSPQPTISRAEQHDVVFDFLMPYLDFILKNNLSAEQVFLDSLTNSLRITYQRSCVNTKLNDATEKVFDIFPNPLINDKILTINSGSNFNNCKIILKDVSGRIVFEKYFTGSFGKVDLNMLQSGLYLLSIYAGNEVHTDKILVF